MQACTMKWATASNWIFSSWLVKFLEKSSFYKPGCNLQKCHWQEDMAMMVYSAVADILWKLWHLLKWESPALDRQCTMSTEAVFSIYQGFCYFPKLNVGQRHEFYSCSSAFHGQERWRESEPFALSQNWGSLCLPWIKEGKKALIGTIHSLRRTVAWSLWLGLGQWQEQRVQDSILHVMILNWEASLLDICWKWKHQPCKVRQ